MDFATAAAAAKVLPNMPNEDKLRLYALYKQATVGPAPDSSNTTVFDFVGQQKYKAWDAVRKLSADEARREYISLVTKRKPPPRGAQQQSTQTSCVAAPSAECPTLSTDALEVMKHDGPLVGTARIFDSSNVWTTSAPQEQIPTPSVYSDARGEIHNVSVGGKRINLLYTRKGVMRSGDLHKNTQNDFVFSGSVEVWTMRPDGGTDKKVYKTHEFLAIPEGVPHIFNFVEDCVLAEWWEPFGSPFGAWFYRPYRELVDASFAPQSSDSPGTMTTLHPTPQPSSRHLWEVGAALFVGLAVGAAAMGGYRGGGVISRR
mmetsp:Transcript_40991/g.108340  ORF Transcript_40991/g.108340 Transcript_40991/m.108340 type:complete len:316 (-) Transcript_40991:331-1278(-)